MANTMLKSLISLITLLLLALSSEVSSSDAAFIVAHKKATLNRLKSGAERVSVSFDIYNEGSAVDFPFHVSMEPKTHYFLAWEYDGIKTAYDVSLTDDSWPQDVFDIVSGNTSISWEKLDAGAVLSHSFELESREKTLFSGAPALITFRVLTKAALQEAFSTPIFPLDILSERPPEKKLDFAKRLLAKYGSLVSVISIVVLFIYLVATPSKGPKGSKKKR